MLDREFTSLTIWTEELMDDAARNAMTVNSAIRSPAEKRISTSAKFLAPLHLTGVAFILNLIGISAFYAPILRGTEEYKKTYNNRTSSEQVNNQVLNGYHLHDMKIHGKKRYSFFAMIAGINIHLDARLKNQRRMPPNNFF